MAEVRYGADMTRVSAAGEARHVSRVLVWLGPDTGLT